MLVQIHQGDINKVLSYYQKDERTKLRAELAWNWVQKHAPEEFIKGQSVILFEEELEILNDFPWTIIKAVKT